MLDEIGTVKRTLNDNSTQVLKTDSLVKQMSGQNDIHENLVHQIKTLIDERTKELTKRLTNIEKQLGNADRPKAV